MSEARMKLMFIIVRDVDGDNVLRGLVEKNFRVTRVASTGGFLRHGNVTLMTGIEDEKVESVVKLLRKICCPSDEIQHRATVFVVDMPYFEQI
jgi:uncharacterized protein YaaQ